MSRRSTTQPGLHVESQVVELAERAELDAFGFVAGGALARRQIFARLVGEDGADRARPASRCSTERRRADTTLEVVHAAPRGEQPRILPPIVADEATGVFQGKVIVAAGRAEDRRRDEVAGDPAVAEATMNAKPELEIFADDVVCGHGATVGALDPEQLFYLQARGIAAGGSRGDAARGVRRRGDRAASPTPSSPKRCWR